MDWKDQYKHPNWQKKRLEALELAGFECQNCGDGESQLQVHHVRYKKGSLIWDYEPTELSVLCEKCHDDAHRSKETINDYCLMNGAGSERVIAELITGYSIYTESLPHIMSSHLEVVGYGAGYLSNLEAEDIFAMTKIAPHVLRAFIMGEKNA